MLHELVIQLINGENPWLTLIKGPILPSKHRRPLVKLKTLKKIKLDEPEPSHKLRRVRTSLRSSMC